jgi:hypothetical protein
MIETGKGQTNLHFEVGHQNQLFGNLKHEAVLTIKQVPNSKTLINNNYVFVIIELGP